MSQSEKSARETKNPLLYLFGKTWSYSAGNRKNIVWFWLMFIVANAIGLFIYPLLTARVIDTVTKQGINTDNVGTLLVLLLLMLLVNLVFWSLHGPARIMERENGFKVRVNYRKHLLKGVMTLPMEWHVDHHSGDTIDKIEKGTTALFAFSENSFEVISGVVHLLVSYCMLVYFSPSSSYIVLMMIAAIVWITIRFDRILVEQYKDLSRAENRISESVFDAVSNITTVIILRVERLIFKAIIHKVEKPYELFQKNSIRNEFKWFLASMCASVTTVLVLAAYFIQNIGAPEGVLAGSVYLLLNYLDRMSDTFYKFTGMYSEILKRKSRVLNAEELSRDFKPENYANHVLPENWKRLDIKGLNFSYGSGEEKILHLDNISMSLARGERIAFVGETGSGKTTMLKLMRDLYHPGSLNLTVDGRLIPQGFEGISRAIALVPQNPEIFATTIIENITLGAEYERAFVEHFTDMACFSDVARKLPRQFDTSIKEKGVNLSGGQQQRLALARGLLACHDKSIVLLDEPTSSLDTATEMRVYENIFREFGGKTIISSVHRLHLLPLFHRIYMFNGGVVVGSGTLGELLSSCPEFEELWRSYTASISEALK